MKLKAAISLLLLLSFGANAREIKGKIRDSKTGEEIIGASIIVKENPTKGVVSGLDGSFNLSVPHEKFTIICTYVGYKRYELQIEQKDSEIEDPIRIAMTFYWKVSLSLPVIRDAPKPEHVPLKNRQ